MLDRQSFSDLLKRARGRLSNWLARPYQQADAATISPRRRLARIAATCGIIFLVALGVRLLYWQDSRAGIDQGAGWYSDLLKPYRMEARRMVRQGGIMFPDEPVDPNDARMIVHPPGYSMLLAAIYKGDECDTKYAALRYSQIACDAMAAALVFLIAQELLPFALAFIAGIFVALSPHFAYNSLRLSPDSLAVLPILLGIYLFARAVKQPRLITFITVGALMGLSCWLRSNALLLAPFLAVAIFFLFERGKRLRYCAVMVCATVAIIAPITIRNRVVYHRFIPLTLPMGINLIQGIAEYDKEGRFAMPLHDIDVQKKEAEWYERPDYAADPWLPDGIEREQARLARGLAVVRSNPGWFIETMLRRAAFMLRYNDTGRTDWPFNTALAPPVSAEPSFGNSLAITGDAQKVWSSSAMELIVGGSIVSSKAEASLAADGQMLQIAGDDSEFGDQFDSGPIAVQKNTDYVLALGVNIENGPISVKVTSTDRRIALASKVVEPKKRPKRKAEKSFAEAQAIGVADQQNVSLIKLPFASGNRTELRFVLSNDGPASIHPVTQISRATIFEQGTTPYQWTRFPRALIRGAQKKLFTTFLMLSLVAAGIALLVIAGRGRALVVLLAVPIYYLGIHSPFSTEYRYILPIHYFLLVLAATTFYCAGKVIAQSFRQVRRAVGIERRASGS